MRPVSGRTPKCALYPTKPPRTCPCGTGIALLTSSSDQRVRLPIAYQRRTGLDNIVHFAYTYAHRMSAFICCTVGMER